MADLMGDIVRFVVKTKYEDLPPEVVDWAKGSIMDTIGVIIAGSSAIGCKTVVDLVREWGGKPESTIPVFGGKVPMPLAGMAIGTMARALDFAGVHAGADNFVTAYTLPGAFPVADWQRCSGKDLIAAIALGGEAVVKIEESVHLLTPPPPVSLYYICSVWGPTAAAGKLLNLDEETLWNAMGLAYSNGGGEAQMYPDAVLKVRVQHGLVADIAIKSVLLAQRGITGTRNILQGEFGGLYTAYYPRYDTRCITEGLENRKFDVLVGITKFYPCCTYAHTSIEAVINCMKENNIRPQDISEIDIGVNKPSFDFSCEPREIKFAPKTIIESQFSLPYTVATAVIKGNVFIDDFIKEALERQDVRQMMEKIKVRIDPEIPYSETVRFGGAKVTMKTRDGKEYYNRVDYAKGTPQNPANMEEIAGKFRQCVPFSVKPLPQKNVAELIDMLEHLEEVKDISRLATLLVP